MNEVVNPSATEGQEIVHQEPEREAVRPLRRSSVLKWKQKNNQLREKNEELKDKYLRLYADFDNYKKRSAREWLEKSREAGKELILQILPVIDDFERAIATMDNASGNAEAVREGTMLIYNKLKKILEQNGVEPMQAKGQPFDPDKHEAISEIPVEKDEDKGMVLEEIQKGYLLNGKILRHAKVVVGK
ncbi:MAG: protein GrpE [Chitinophagales bacterium]|nr:MAG: protein GrpE [Chitinophagales bacterium]